MRQLRNEAAHRQRRIIFNNDGNDARMMCPTPTPEAMLELRTTPLLGSQVDSIFYCDTLSFNFLNHNSNIAEVCTEPVREEPQLAMNITGALIEQGTDPLQVMVEFCRGHDLEIFWSMRMNDIHDADISLMLPQYKRDHPEYLFGTPRQRPPYGAWSGVDFGQEPIRERAFLIIQEVCQEYDVDGVELDFMRSPVMFNSQAWGQPVTQDERDAMTEFVRRVYLMTDEEASKRGRPLLIAVRVPDSIGFCHAIGLDVERWLEEGLTDLLIVGGDFELSPLEESVTLAHRHGVPIYASLHNEGRKPTPGRRARSRPEAYRARAMNAWNAGVDGIHMFNLFTPLSPQWRELGDPQTLRKLDKVYYCNGTAGFSLISTHLAEGDRFLRVPTLSPEYPMPLNPGERVVLPLAIGEDVLWGKNQDIMPQLLLRLQVEGLAGAQDLSVTLNGHGLEGSIDEGGLAYVPNPEWVLRGTNEVEVVLAAGCAPGPVLQDIQLRVGYLEAREVTNER
ncbi:MAG: hypothetical protein ACOX9R_06585 [Armatimonadota bacterium]